MLNELLGRLRGKAYQAVMRFAHRHHWHYAPPIYPGGDTHLWCQWCGFRQTIKRAEDPDCTAHGTEAQKRDRECERLRRALHDIAEEWAGAECGEPVHAQEAYAIGLAKRMYSLAVEGLGPNKE